MTQTLYLYEAGSRLTGTSLNTSDNDRILVHLEPLESLLGIAGESRATQREENGDDVAVQPLRKFVGLLAQGNPNMVQGLFVPDHLRYEVHPAFQKYILDQTEMFVSQQAAARFKGYAYQQFETVIAKRPARVQRPELVEKHGFDTKFAGHAYRLTAQGIEYLTTGRLQLPMPDESRQVVLDIREGKYSKDDAVALIQQAIHDLDRAHDESTLPEKPDYDRINEALIDLHAEVYKDAFWASRHKAVRSSLYGGPAPYLRY